MSDSRVHSCQSVLETDAVQLALEQSLEQELESRGLAESPEAERRLRRVLYARAEAILAGMRTTVSTVLLRRVMHCRDTPCGIYVGLCMLR